MSRSYTIVNGDTFRTISLKVYGVENHADLIEQANPGVPDPLPLNFVIVIPDNPDDPADANRFLGVASPDEIVLSIENERYRFWDKMNIRRSIDKISTIGFSAPFDPDNDKFRSTFTPFSFKPVGVAIGRDRLFTGTMVSVKPQVSNDRRIVTVSGYSKPGVLNDCTASSKSWPLSFSEGLDLRDIANQLCRPFGISTDFEGSIGSALPKSIGLQAGQKILPFLIALAQQRGFIVSSTPDGKLFFRRSNEDVFPVAEFIEGSSPALSVTPIFNEQSYYSHLSGYKPKTIINDAVVYPRSNPHLKGVVRPFTFGLTDVEGGDVSVATNAKMGRMFGSAMSWEVVVPTWRNQRGILFDPNTYVTLDYPSAMIYGKYNFLIRDVEFEVDANSRTARLTLVLPGSFNGVIPERLPWQE